MTVIAPNGGEIVRRGIGGQRYTWSVTDDVAVASVDLRIKRGRSQS